MKRWRRGHRAPPLARGHGLFADDDATLLDLVDNVLTKGVLIDGEIILGLANVDLVYLRLSAVLCAADRVFPSGSA